MKALVDRARGYRETRRSSDAGAPLIFMLKAAVERQARDVLEMAAFVENNG